MAREAAGDFSLASIWNRSKEVHCILVAGLCWLRTTMLSCCESEDGTAAEAPKAPSGLLGEGLLVLWSVRGCQDIEDGGPEGRGMVVRKEA